MDWDKIEQLLNVAEGALRFGAPLKHVHDAAVEEIVKLTRKPEPQAPQAIRRPSDE